MKWIDTEARISRPPDHEQRNLILTELDRNMLVEAAAGTGKTTSMLKRMLALLAGGRCANIRGMVAITFTRKAAAELRSRFQIELEAALREAAGVERENLERALNHLEQCFIGTIHSFCARLLRERPVDAGVDLAFEEIDERADLRLRRQAWEEFASRLIANDPGDHLDELHGLGLKLADLEEAFMRFADFPDVDEWPVPEVGSGELRLEGALAQLRGYADHMGKLAPRLPRHCGNDTLIPEFARLPRVISHYRELHRPDQLMEVLERFDTKVEVRQKEWKKEGAFTGEEAKAEGRRWEDFREEVVRPNLRAWRELRYARIMRLLIEAREVYDDLRRQGSKLNFQDLLMKAASLLREHPNVRLYFQRRFTHILVDEFQDTDPIQAEVIILLTSSDPNETRWRRCAARPGSLFVVGDPKQSIYRFRRADIVTYNEVKEIVRRGGGRGKEGSVLQLSANFRASAPVIDWVNRVFEPFDHDRHDEDTAMLRFPEEEAEHTPAYVSLMMGRQDENLGYFSGPFRLHIPDKYTKKEQAINYEADLIARTIRSALDSRITVPRSGGQADEGRMVEIGPSDFMIIALNKGNLRKYAGKLREYGISHRVTGGGVLNEVGELKLLYTCLRAIVYADDPVALVGALRSELFGVSDAALYAFKKAGGRFSFRADLPHGFTGPDAEALKDALLRLRSYSLLLSNMPPVTAFEMIAADLGLPPLAAAQAGGDMEAGSFAKAMELLREVQVEMWTKAQLVEFLAGIIEREESYDGISALSGEGPAVQVMNLHKAKGLEAPIVFLADPHGDSDHEIDRHIDRSGDKILGYLAIFGQGSPYGRPGRLLAHPASWDILADKERRFLLAEQLRLRYVAATRSGSATIISQKAKRNIYNPWRHFDAHLPADSALADPGPQALPGNAPRDLTLDEIRSASEDISKRLSQCLEPTHEARAAKEFALSQYSIDLGPSENLLYEPEEASDGVEAGPRVQGEDAVALGEIIHLLIEASTKYPDSELDGMAAAALEARGLDLDLTRYAVTMTRSVTRSPLWQRVLASPRRLTEVPFQFMLMGEGPVPTLLRGVIDLAFREAGGWVLVDYKTDRIRGRSPEALLDPYRPQMEIYAKAWEDCSGETVTEALIYFLETGLIARIV